MPSGFRHFENLNEVNRFGNLFALNRSLTVAARIGAFPSRDRQGAVAAAKAVIAKPTIK